MIKITADPKVGEITFRLSMISSYNRLCSVPHKTRDERRAVERAALGVSQVSNAHVADDGMLHVTVITKHELPADNFMSALINIDVRVRKELFGLARENTDELKRRETAAQRAFDNARSPAQKAALVAANS